MFKLHINDEWTGSLLEQKKFLYGQRYDYLNELQWKSKSMLIHVKWNKSLDLKILDQII